MQGYPPTSGYDYNGTSVNHNSVKEERITTVLQKGVRGFGFTIVGGDHPEELLQVKSIVPGGAASVDGKIRIGDALTKVNGMYVSHFNLILTGSVYIVYVLHISHQLDYEISVLSSTLVSH